MCFTSPSSSKPNAELTPLATICKTQLVWDCNDAVQFWWMDNGFGTVPGQSMSCDMSATVCRSLHLIFCCQERVGRSTGTYPLAARTVLEENLAFTLLLPGECRKKHWHLTSCCQDSVGRSTDIYPFAARTV